MNENTMKKNAVNSIPSEDPMLLINLLPIGKENSISRKRLANELGLTERDTSRRVHDLRAAGFIILSGSQGYYIASDKAEVKEFYVTMRKRAVSLLSVLKTTRKYLEAEEQNE